MLPTWVLSVPDWPNVDPMDLAFRVYCFLLEAALIIRSKCRLVNQPRGRLTAMVLSISHPKILNSYYDNFFTLLSPTPINELEFEYNFIHNTENTTSWWRHQMETCSALLALCAGIHWSLVNSPHKGQWRGALMFSLICAWINGCVNNREVDYLGRHRVHYGGIVMIYDKAHDRRSYTSAVGKLR